MPDKWLFKNGYGSPKFNTKKTIVITITPYEDQKFVPELF